MTDQADRYEQLSERALWYLQNLDELDLAEECASSEATQKRVTAVYQQWVMAGPPPLGASMARWWDARLVELRQAIAEQSARTTANNSPTSSNATDNALAGVIQVATSRYKAEQGEPAPVLEALGYHAMGQGIDLERLTIQRDQLADDLRYALADHGPRHNHLQPGLWDDTGQPCQHCQRLEQARQNLAALNPQKEPTP
jgi:hypothetical protein